MAKGRPSHALKFYSIKEAADIFGVSERTVRRWMSRGRLKFHQWDGIIRISHEDLMACAKAAHNG